MLARSVRCVEGMVLISFMRSDSVVGLSDSLLSLWHGTCATAAAVISHPHLHRSLGAMEVHSEVYLFPYLDPLDLLSLRDQIADLRRQHHLTAIIPPKELRMQGRRFLRNILLHEMSRLRNDCQLEFPLHLPDHQFAIQTVCARKNEHFRASSYEEFGRHSLEPFLPPWGCGL